MHISIQIPLIRDVEYLFSTLESLVNQTYTNWECHIVLYDNTISGHVEAVAMAFCDPRILVHTVSDYVVKGESIQMNVGDIWHPKKLSEIETPKLRILTTVCNQPDFVRAQVKALKKWIRVEYEFVVFNDAKDWPDITNFGDCTMRRQIEDVCKELGIVCIPVQNIHHRHLHSASHRHCDTLRCVMEYVRNTGVGRYWMIDSDMWPIGPYSEELLNLRFQGTGTFVRQEREGIVYAWPNLWWLSVRRVEDLDGLSWNLAPQCDTGGASAQWMARNNVRWLDPHRGSCAWGPGDSLLQILDVQKFLDEDPRNTNNKYWSEIYDDRLFHIRAGSNWNGEGSVIHSKIADLVQSYFL
jgi:hypothetical protein